MDLRYKAGRYMPDLSYKNYIVQKRTHGNGKPHPRVLASKTAVAGKAVSLVHKTAAAGKAVSLAHKPGRSGKAAMYAGARQRKTEAAPKSKAPERRSGGIDFEQQIEYLLQRGKTVKQRTEYVLRQDKKPHALKTENERADEDLIFLDLDGEESVSGEEPLAEGQEEETAREIREETGARPHVFRVILLLAVCVLFLLAAVGGIVYYRAPYRCVKGEITVEAGEMCPPVSAFLNWECKDAYIVSGIDENAVLDHVADHEIVIRLYHRDVTATLHVEDTVKPELETQGKTIMYGESFEVLDFVKSVSDRTDCEVAFKEQPEITGGGIYRLVLAATDEGGNVTEMPAQLEVIQDVTPPVIEGVKELSILVGESVSYKRDVTVMDDYDENVRLVVDNSEVDVDTPGDYAVIYRATDKYGNTAEVSTVLHVRKPQIPQQQVVAGIPVTEEAVNAEADKILAAITNESMTQLEVLRAIYDWCYNKIAYVNGTPKTNWVEGAYCGIVNRRGDCYAYAMSAKCLLTRAGIVNLDIERIRVGNGMHFWNLVDIGEGWHHFDTCRRGDGVQFFYLTDAELMVYSDSHRRPEYPDGSHHYDRSLYPKIE